MIGILNCLELYQPLQMKDEDFIIASRSEP